MLCRSRSCDASMLGQSRFPSIRIVSDDRRSRAGRERLLPRRQSMRYAHGGSALVKNPESPRSPYGLDARYRNEPLRHRFRGECRDTDVRGTSLLLTDMKYLDEYRNADAARQLAAAIARVTTRPWNIMEVCGGQTHAILRFGLDEMLPPEITLIHGPGCPVCVTPMEMIDRAVGHRRAAGGDLLLVRRHAAGAGLDEGPASR